MARDRFTERVAKRKRRTWTWVISLLALVLLLVAIGWAAWSTSWLAAKEVRVVGTQHLPADDVIAAAEVPMGTSLLQIEREPISERVADLRIVDEVSVSREFPNTILITVKERQAVAWLQRGSTPWAVDATGSDYRPLASRPKHLPELKAKRSDRRSMKATAQVATELAQSDADIFRRVKSISAKSRDSIELNLKSGKTVAWGDAELTEQKARTLAALLTVSARHYDVSAPERPTTRE